MTGSFAKPPSKLRWIKTCDGVWVDRDAFYCVRRISACNHRHADLSGLDAYEAYETYPGCFVDLVVIAPSLCAAKQACWLHRDALNTWADSAARRYGAPTRSPGPFGEKGASQAPPPRPFLDPDKTEAA